MIYTPPLAFYPTIYTPSLAFYPTKSTIYTSLLATEVWHSSQPVTFLQQWLNIYALPSQLYPFLSHLHATPNPFTFVS